MHHFGSHVPAHSRKNCALRQISSRALCVDMSNDTSRAVLLIAAGAAVGGAIAFGAALGLATYYSRRFDEIKGQQEQRGEPPPRCLVRCLPKVYAQACASYTVHIPHYDVLSSELLFPIPRYRANHMVSEVAPSTVSHVSVSVTGSCAEPTKIPYPLPTPPLIFQPAAYPLYFMSTRSTG